jgi:hypothetical protein
MGGALFLESSDSLREKKSNVRGPKWRVTLSPAPTVQNTKPISKMIMGR